MNKLLSFLVFVLWGVYLFFLIKKSNIRLLKLSQEKITYNEFQKKYKRIKWKFLGNIFIGLYFALILMLILVLSTALTK